MKGAGGIPTAPRFLHDLTVLPQNPIHTWVPVDRGVCVCRQKDCLEGAGVEMEQTRSLGALGISQDSHIPL